MIRKICAIAAVALLVAAPALAETFIPVKHGTYLFDLDTMDGAFSLWKTEEVADINAVRAHITMHRKGGGKWAPTVNIRIKAGERSATLKFVAVSKGGQLFGGLMNGDKEVDSGLLILSSPELKEPFDVHASWTPEGKVSFNIFTKATRGKGQGYSHVETDIGGPITAIEITNSTSEVEFNKLELGNLTP